MEEILNGLYLINLDQPVTGFRNFISSWVLKTAQTTILVDPGPASSIVHLTSELNRLGIKHLDFILLTHIHIDHAGGTGLILKKFPEACVVCHPKAIKHLINPEKLWKGSLEVLGKLAEVYGPISAIPEGCLISEGPLRTADLTIEVVETPGHAAHHVVYLIDDLLFMGEVAGVNIPLPDRNYLRVATPPVFKYEVYRDSLQKAGDLKARHLCFGHYGYRNDSDWVFTRAREQLDLWIEIVERNLLSGHDDEETIWKELLQKDPQLMAFPHLPPDIQERERYFCKNSIRGMLQYLQEKEAS